MALIFIVEINGRPIGMAASLPNVNEALSGPWRRWITLSTVEIPLAAESAQALNPRASC